MNHFPFFLAINYEMSFAGAVIEDGRLRSGDRLLEVNGMEMTGKTQSDVVSLLRNIPSGGVARLLISRQETDEEIQQHSNQIQNQQLQSATQQSPKLPRQMKSMSRASEESLLLLPWKQREILTLDIPVHDTEKAGLGISVKGKTTSSSGTGTSDLGIFIKSVLHGGAASRDGRLCTNDQLLHVNGVSLQGRSNTEAMEGLRRAVHQEGPKPGHIILTVAGKMHVLKDREVTLEGQSQDDTVNGTVRLGGDSSSSYDHSGGSSDQSDSTVIFVSGSGSDSRERNLMKDNRLSGISSDLRNESYYRVMFSLSLSPHELNWFFLFHFNFRPLMKRGTRLSCKKLCPSRTGDNRASCRDPAGSRIRKTVQRFTWLPARWFPLTAITFRNLDHAHPLWWWCRRPTVRLSPLRRIRPSTCLGSNRTTFVAVNALDRRTDVIDRGPNSRRRRVPCQRHPCDRMEDDLAIRMHRLTPASKSLDSFNFISLSFIIFFLLELLWIRTPQAFLASSLVVRACRKNGTPRWTPRAQTLIKEIKNSGWLTNN